MTTTVEEITHKAHIRRVRERLDLLLREATPLPALHPAPVILVRLGVVASGKGNAPSLTVSSWPSLRAVAYVRSQMTPPTNGPRSITGTVIDLPPAKSSTEDPHGSDR